MPATRGWILFFILPLLTFWLTPTAAPRWLAMWLICGSVYAGCKWLTWRRTHLPPSPALRERVATQPPGEGSQVPNPHICTQPLTVPAWQHAAYLFAWPGLDAATFLKPVQNAAPFQPTRREWTFATTKLLCGALMFWVIPREIPTDWPLVRGWSGMIGIVFLLHFGLFHLLSCFWRARGIDAKPLMDWPIASTSVSDFWGRRWNRAFRDLTHRFLFRPLTHLVGPRWGMAAGFLFSGLVHELAITVPAGGGYGGPTLFFGIQAAALMFERSSTARRLKLGREGSITGWLFTVLVLMVPAGLLFPPPFVERIILPFMTACGAFSP